MQKKYSCIKKCFVPMCKSSSNLHKEKLFILVPNDPEIKENWFKKVNKTYKLELEKATFHCCQDHFDFDNDLDDHPINKLGKGFSLKLNVIPHILQCQDDYRKECASVLPKVEQQQKSTNEIENADNLNSNKKEDKMDIDTNGREFKKIVYNGNKKLTLYIKSPDIKSTQEDEDDDQESKNDNESELNDIDKLKNLKCDDVKDILHEIDMDSDIEISSLSTISSVSSTGLNTTSDSDMEL